MEKCEDAKGVTGSRKPEDKQYNDHNQTDKRTSNDLQNYRPSNTNPTKTGVNSGDPEG